MVISKRYFFILCWELNKYACMNFNIITLLHLKRKWIFICNRTYGWTRYNNSKIHYYFYYSSKLIIPLYVFTDAIRYKNLRISVIKTFFLFKTFIEYTNIFFFKNTFLILCSLVEKSCVIFGWTLFFIGSTVKSCNRNSRTYTVNPVNPIFTDICSKHEFSA